MIFFSRLGWSCDHPGSNVELPVLKPQISYLIIRNFTNSADWNLQSKHQSTFWFSRTFSKLKLYVPKSTTNNMTPLCYGLNSVSTKFIYWHSKPQYLRMWQYLDMSPLKNMVKSGYTGGLTPLWLCLYKSRCSIPYISSQIYTQTQGRPYEDIGIRSSVS